MPDVAQPGPGLDHADAAPHGLVACSRQPAGEDPGIADEVHAAGIAMKAVANHGDVDIDDVAALQSLVAGNSMAYDMVHRGADGLGKASVVEVGRDRLQLVHDEVVTAFVELVGGRPGLNNRLRNFQEPGSPPAR